MKMEEVFQYTFKALTHKLGLNRARNCQPMWQRRLSADSEFCRAVVANGYLTEAQMQHAASRYRLGKSRDGGVIFWQTGPRDTIYDGKIMYYRPDCHRDHERHPQWVSSLLKCRFLQQFPDMAPWMPESYHCLFGLHLLATTDKTIAVVEAEKTAVIMSEVKPDYVWMAAGGLFELTADKLFPLRHHRIVLLPDTDPDLRAYTRWYNVATEGRHKYDLDITVSPLLELRATPDQKRRKIDLVDFLFEHTEK